MIVKIQTPSQVHLRELVNTVKYQCSQGWERSGGPGCNASVGQWCTTRTQR
jgi:hypothetical protein